MGIGVHPDAKTWPGMQLGWPPQGPGWTQADSKQPLSPSCPRELSDDGHTPASYRLVILRRARSGDSGFDVAYDPWQWGALGISCHVCHGSQ